MKARCQIAGFSILEALIAALVLSLGVLSIVALQARTVNEYRDSKMRQYATFLAGDLTDRIRANRAGAEWYSSVHFPTAANKTCATSTTPACAAADLAADDLFHWKSYLSTLGFNLMTGDATVDSTVTVNASTTPIQVSVQLRWPSSKGVRAVVINTEVL